MNYLLSSAILTLALTAAPTVFADGGGACHFHGKAEAKEAVVVGCAKGQLSSLVAKAKIEASWKSAALDRAETVDGKNAKEWKVTFKNPAAADASKKTLYMFFALNGNFIAANFTGQ